MKWHIARIIIILVLALQFQLFALLENPIPVKAATSTADVTVYVTLTGGGLMPPSGFTVTRITDTEVLIEWTPAEGSANTSIRMKVNSLPGSVSDGYLVYCGNASTFTDYWLDLDVIWSEVYYAAYSQNATGHWSESFVWDYTESPYVEEVANNLSSLGNLSTAVAGLVYLLPLAAISALAFWKENHVLFMLAFGLAMIAGLNAPDIISGSYETTPMGITLGALLLVFGILCAALSFRLMFWRGGEE